MTSRHAAAYRAAILLAGYTRDHDLSDAAFSRALDNAAQYYGADVQSTLAVFDNLSADEYFSTAVGHFSTAVGHFSTAVGHFGAAQISTDKGAPWS